MGKNRWLGRGLAAALSTVLGSAVAAGINIATGHLAWGAILGTVFLVALLAWLESWRASKDVAEESPRQAHDPPHRMGYQYIPTLAPQPKKVPVKTIITISIIGTLATSAIPIGYFYNRAINLKNSNIAALKDFAGNWFGLARNLGMKEYWTIRIRINKGRDFGIVEYAVTKCSGQVTPKKSTSKQIILREVITYSNDCPGHNAPRDIKLSKRKDGKVNIAMYEKEGSSQVGATAVASKQPTTDTPRLPDGFGGTWTRGKQP